MSFVFYDLTFLVVFSLVVAGILIFNKKQVKREGLFLLYRTKWGIKLINYISGKNKKFLNGFEYVLIFFGFLLMAGAIWSFGQFIYIFLVNPEFVRAIKIPPIAPLIPYLPQLFGANYLPFFYFTYWIIVLAITAIVHEFFHGIFAKARDIKIKSTGFYFLGPFFGAFVEPDEKKIGQLKKRSQMAFLSAGSFSNLLIGILFFAVLVAFFFLAYTPSGVIFQDYSQSIVNTSQISVMNSKINISGNILVKIEADNISYYADANSIPNLSNYSLIYVYDDSPALKAGIIGAIIAADDKKIKENNDLNSFLESKKPGDKINLETNYQNVLKNYSIILANNPRNSSRAYLGIAQVDLKSINSRSSIFGRIRNSLVYFKNPNTYYQPKVFGDLTVFIYNLIWWIILINLGVALFNMLPLGIADGGQVFYLLILAITKSEKTSKIVSKIATYLILFSFLIVTIMWFRSFG